MDILSAVLPDMIAELLKARDAGTSLAVGPEVAGRFVSELVIFVCMDTHTLLVQRYELPRTLLRGAR